MSMKTYPMRVEDGKVYAEVTLRDVVERCDVSDLPLLAEIKRLYTENDRMRELVREAIYARDDADWASIVSTAIALGVEVDDGVS